MFGKLKYITAIALMTLLPLITAGVSIHHHICNTSNLHLTSAFIPIECSHYKDEVHDNQNCCRANHTDDCGHSECNDRNSYCSGDASNSSSRIAQAECCQSFIQHIALESTFIYQQISKVKNPVPVFCETTLLTSLNDENAKPNSSAYEELLIPFYPNLFNITHIHFSSLSFSADDCVS